MALGINHVTTGGTTTNKDVGLTYGPASDVTIHEDCLALVWVAMAETGGAAAEPIVAGLSATWDLVETIGSGLDQGWLYVAEFAGDQTGPLTFEVTSVEHEGALWSVNEVSGALLGNNGMDALLQVVTNFAGSGTDTSSLTMEAFTDAVNNATFLAAYSRNGADMTTTDLSLLGTSNIGSPNKNIGTAYEIGEDTTPLLTWGASAAWRAIGLEIAEASAGVAGSPHEYGMGIPLF